MDPLPYCRLPRPRSQHLGIAAYVQLASLGFCGLQPEIKTAPANTLLNQKVIRKGKIKTNLSVNAVPHEKEHAIVGMRKMLVKL